MIIVRSVEYHEDVETRTLWLRDAERGLEEDAPHDSLQIVTLLLQDQENVIAKMDAQRPVFKADIAEGKKLMSKTNAPEFLVEAVKNLEKRWQTAEKKAKDKHLSLKDSKQNWEQYESARQPVTELLKKVNNELSRFPANAGQEAVQKELSKKREMLEQLQMQRPALQQVTQLTGKLQQKASEPRQQGLQQDLVELEETLGDTTQHMDTKVRQLQLCLHGYQHVMCARDVWLSRKPLESFVPLFQVKELEDLDRRWTEFYENLEGFAGWLNQKENDLSGVSSTSGSPEEQFKRTEVSFRVFSVFNKSFVECCLQVRIRIKNGR